MTVQGMPARQVQTYLPPLPKARVLPDVTSSQSAGVHTRNQGRPERLAPVPLHGQFAVLSYTRNAAAAPNVRVATVDEFV